MRSGGGVPAFVIDWLTVSPRCFSVCLVLVDISTPSTSTTQSSPFVFKRCFQLCSLIHWTLIDLLSCLPPWMSDRSLMRCPAYSVTPFLPQGPPLALWPSLDPTASPGHGAAPFLHVWWVLLGSSMQTLLAAPSDAQCRCGGSSTKLCWLFLCNTASHFLFPVVFCSTRRFYDPHAEKCFCRVCTLQGFMEGYTPLTLLSHYLSGLFIIFFCQSMGESIILLMIVVTCRPCCLVFSGSSGSSSLNVFLIALADFPIFVTNL